MSFKGFSWSDQVNGAGGNDETPSTTPSTTTSSSSTFSSPTFSSEPSTLNPFSSSLFGGNTTNISPSSTTPTSLFSQQLQQPRQQQQSSSSSSMFDTTNYNNNNGFSSLFGGNSNNNTYNNNIDQGFDSSNIFGNNNKNNNQNEFDINMLPDDDIDLSKYNHSNDGAIVSEDTYRSALNDRLMEQYDNEANRSVSGLQMDEIDDPDLDWFRHQTLNKTDDDIFYEIIEKQATIASNNNNNNMNNDTNNQDNQFAYLQMVDQFKTYFVNKLSLLKYQLERHYHLPNKKDTERQIDQVQNEKNTWDILCRLYQDRDKDYPEERDQPDDIQMDSNISQVDVVALNIKRDYQMRENIIVLNWLEEMASMIKYTDEPVYWKKTLEAIKTGNKQHLVQFLDPDAQQRLNLKIDAIDEKDDHQFLSTLWSLLRVGNRELAIQFCQLVGQHWRAQTLIGDAKFASELEIGNPYRNLWRQSCLTLSNNASDEYERAIYGVLAANVGNALPVCKNWYDYLWVYVRVLIDIKLNEELKSIPVPPTSYEDIPPLPTASTFRSTTDILHILRTNSPVDIIKQSMEPYNIIQDRLISDDYQTLLQSLLDILKSGKQSPDFLRLSIGLVLFYRFRTINYQPNPDEQSPENVIIHSYIQYLIDTQKHELVALYTSFLGNDVQRTKLYSKFLEGITELEERQRCLGLAERYNLDTELITETVVNNINAKNRGVSSRSMSTTTEADVAKIDAIGWLCFNPQQRIEAILKSNLLIREFVENNKLDAAQQLIDALPKNSVAISKMESTRSESETIDIIKEFTNWSQYLEATRRIGIWFHNYSKKPKQSTLHFRLTGKESYAQKLDLERKKKEVEEEFGQWSQNNMLYGRDAIESVNTIIKQSWLCPESIQDVNPSEYQKQIHSLRVSCIPPLFFSLHQLLVGTEQYKKSSRICNLIADERLKWYNVFNREQIQEMLSLVQKSLITMMERQDNQSNNSYDILQYKQKIKQ
ncbi:nucleoporin 107 [Heterostelium album PN500]|uniref:Nuclear pore complex protein n=1 Tax=Heterostelium pallidum (strain ATCC 26659 / Pp 5 / PN500) TaxID=670386 RepID=D3B447_HETP5|nr:nucleoporin 107 [Heterostelium album PN500]EFA84095.1 nucleoporin 107 [Heterostelium album PN500]|eukprot:XP_020436212.1 nucleoporin 107 [Heterostelium album PN500]